MIPAVSVICCCAALIFAAPPPKIKPDRDFVDPAPSADAIAVSTNGKFAVTGGIDGILRIWDIAAGRQLRTLQGHAGRVSCVAVSTDNIYVASGGVDGTVRVWNADNGDLESVMPQPHWVYHLVWPDRQTVLASDSDGIVRLWDVKREKLLTQIESANNSVCPVAASPDGKRALVIGHDCVRLVELPSGQEIHRLDCSLGAIHTLGFSADGQSAMATTSKPARLLAWRVSDGNVIHQIDLRAGPGVAVLSPDGTQLLCTRYINQFVVRDPMTAKIRCYLPGVKGISWTGAFSADNRYVIGVGLTGLRRGDAEIDPGGDPMIHVWDLLAPDSGGL